MDPGLPVSKAHAFPSCPVSGNCDKIKSMCAQSFKEEENDLGLGEEKRVSPLDCPWPWQWSRRLECWAGVLGKTMQMSAYFDPGFHDLEIKEIIWHHGKSVSIKMHTAAGTAMWGRVHNLRVQEQGHSYGDWNPIRWNLSPDNEKHNGHKAKWQCFWK